MSVKHNLLSALERHRGEEISGKELADPAPCQPGGGLEGRQSAGGGGLRHRRPSRPGLPAASG